MVSMALPLRAALGDVVRSRQRATNRKVVAGKGPEGHGCDEVKPGVPQRKPPAAAGPMPSPARDLRRSRKQPVKATPKVQARRPGVRPYWACSAAVTDRHAPRRAGTVVSDATGSPSPQRTRE